LIYLQKKRQKKLTMEKIKTAKCSVNKREHNTSFNQNNTDVDLDDHVPKYFLKKQECQLKLAANSLFVVMV